MPDFIIKIKDRYFIWSTIVDAPLYGGMDLETLQKYTILLFGDIGLHNLPMRLERVEKTGTSQHYSNLEMVLATNRAGDGEKHLTSDEIYDNYGKENLEDFE